jgi:RNA polymerase sigma-70 factor (ECF subfamily)
MEGGLPEERVLVARVAATGDHAAFAALVRRHQSAIRGLLRRLCAGDAATADDIAQEVFMQAYRRMPTFRGDARLSSWLYRIAYNAFVSHRRKRRPEGENLDALQDHPAPSGPSMIARHDVHRAFAVLREEERAALSLTFGAELTHEEAAEILGWPLGTLKTHVNRGKAKLKKRLAAWKAEATA